MRMKLTLRAGNNVAINTLIPISCIAHKQMIRIQPIAKCV